MKTYRITSKNPLDVFDGNVVSPMQNIYIYILFVGLSIAPICCQFGDCLHFLGIYHIPEKSPSYRGLMGAQDLRE